MRVLVDSRVGEYSRDEFMSIDHVYVPTSTSRSLSLLLNPPFWNSCTSLWHYYDMSHGSARDSFLPPSLPYLT